MKLHVSRHPRHALAPRGFNGMTIAAPAAVRVKADAWFEHLFGFSEAAALFAGRGLGGSAGLAAVCAKFELAADGTLTSKVNGASYGSGNFSTPSLAELRSEASGAALLAGEVTVRHVATPDVFELHTRPEFAGATFMAASQFNTLEFASPGATPEDGVTGYVYDATQGPACALAAPAATVVRNYLALVPAGRTGQSAIGQSAAHQLNLLGELLQLVQGSAGEAGSQPPPLVAVRNGYTSSDEARLRNFNARLRGGRALSREELAGALRVGLHSGVGVPWASERFVLKPAAERQVVSQVFCSALACGYSAGSLAAWEPLARLVLEAAYEATLLAALLEEPAEGARPPVVLITFLGGGVFGNADAWIETAIARAVAKVRRLGAALDVVVTHHGRVDDTKATRLEQAIADGALGGDEWC